MKQKKQLLCWLLILTMLAGILPVSVLTGHAEEGAAIIGSGECGLYGDYVEWVLTDDGVMTISGYGRMAYYHENVTPPWYDLKDQLTKLVIKNGVTSVSHRGFQGCTSLKEVVLEEGVERIEYRAFSGCTALEKITIPSTLYYIGDLAFFNTEGKTDVYISDLQAWCNVTFENGAMNPMDDGGGELYLNGEVLTALTIPDGVTDFSVAFSSCTSLTDVTIPYGISQIPDYAFWSCENLTHVNIPHSVTEIGGYAFQGCTSLTDVSLPLGLRKISMHAFEGCTALAEIEIPDSVKHIDRWSFARCTNLQSVTMPQYLDVLEEWVFYGCTSLTEFALSNVAVVDVGAFEYCSSLESIYIPDYTTEICRDVFSGCSDLKNIYYGGDGASWAAVTIGNNNTQLEKCALYVSSSALGDGDLVQTPSENILTGDVEFFYFWDEQKQIAYFGRGDYTGSAVAEETDLSFLEQVEELVGQHVLVERVRANGYEPDTLIRITPVVSAIGVVTEGSADSVTIDGVEYPLPENAMHSGFFYEGEEVVYHLSDGMLADMYPLIRCYGRLQYRDDPDIDIMDETLDHVYHYLISPIAYDLELESGEGYSDSWIAYTKDPYGMVYALDRYSPQKVEIKVDYDALKPIPEEDSILLEYVEDWEAAYDDLIYALSTALEEYSGTSGSIKEASIAAEAARMQREDRQSLSNHIVFTSNFPEEYRQLAYRAYATHLYETLCKNPDFSSISLSSSTAGIQLAKCVAGSLVRSNANYQYDQVNIQLSLLQYGSSNFGSLTCTVANKDDGVTKYTAAVCSTQAECEESIQYFMDQLMDLGTSAAQNVYSAVATDILGKSLYSLTSDYLSKTVSRIEKYLAVKLTEHFKLAGVGDLIQTLDTCYTYNKWVCTAARKLKKTDLEGVLDNVITLRFEDDTIKNALVKKAMKALSTAAHDLNDACNHYLAGTLLDEENSFWKVLFNCPVDVEIFDSNGTQIGFVGAQELWHTDDIRVREFGGSKMILGLTDEPLSFRVVGTGNGVMNCVFEERDGSCAIGRLNYYDIPVAEDQEFTVSLCDDLAEHARTLVLESGNETYAADEYLSAGTDGSVMVSCAVETDTPLVGGTVSGYGTYVRGDAVVMRACVRHGYRFAGWYDNGVLVCVEKTYEFTARDHTSLCARFLKDDSVFVRVEAEEGGAAVGSGRYQLGETVVLTATAEPDALFNGWYIRGELVSKTPEYMHTVESDVVCTASFTPHTHVWDAGTITVEPTESEEGEIVYTCVECGAWYAETLPVLEHHHSYQAIVTPPTCTETGYTTHQCVCGESYVDNHVDALGHAMGEWETVVAATCIEEGEEQRKCIRCDYSECRVVNVVEHSWDDGVISREPTEETEGERMFTCTVCGVTRTEPIPVLEHEHYYEASVTDPTCTEQGCTTYTCRCGAHYTADHTAALGHDFGEWETVTEATYTKNGEERRRCSRCGYTEQRFTDKLANPFADVKSGSFYYDPVMWAVDHGITNGTTETTFGPNDSCMRAHVVTFLWRSKGSPEPEQMGNPFVDVKPTDFYYKAVLWAVENGITNGLDSDHFGPFAYCNRAQVVTFLYRTMGSPEVNTTDNPFTDVTKGSFYDKPVLWAVEKGITNGLSATVFGPGVVCNRAQIVTFLYRALVD